MEQTFAGVVRVITDLLSGNVVRLIFALSLVVFIWGALKYFRADTDEDERKEGVKIMFYGIIALFIMVAVWSIVSVIAGTFNIPLGIPQIH